MVGKIFINGAADTFIDPNGQNMWRGFFWDDNGLRCPGCTWTYSFDDGALNTDLDAAVDAHIPFHA